MLQEHTCKLRDSDHHFIIDPITRSVTNTGSKKTKLMQRDHNSECFSFEITKEVEGHDMSQCNVVRIHYINTDNEVSTKGLYEVDDLTLVDDDKVIFSWTVSEQATQHAGPLSFIIEFKCVNDEGKTIYRWWSDSNTTIQIASGFYNDDYIIENYIDVLDKWKAELEAAASHSHNNKDVLDKFSKHSDMGVPQYEGDIIWTSTCGGVISNIEEKSQGDIVITVLTGDGEDEDFTIKAPITKTSQLTNDSEFVTSTEITNLSNDITENLQMPKSNLLHL